VLRLPLPLVILTIAPVSIVLAWIDARVMARRQ
jgi:hypothetical protein